MIGRVKNLLAGFLNIFKIRKLRNRFYRGRMRMDTTATLELTKKASFVTILRMYETDESREILLRNKIQNLRGRGLSASEAECLAKEDLGIKG